MNKLIASFLVMALVVGMFTESDGWLVRRRWLRRAVSRVGGFFRKHGWKILNGACTATCFAPVPGARAACALCKLRHLRHLGKRELTEEDYQNLIKGVPEQDREYVLNEVKLAVKRGLDVEDDDMDNDLLERELQEFDNSPMNADRREFKDLMDDLPNDADRRELKELMDDQEN